MRVYINGGKGIEKPIDFLGNEIKEGDILTNNFIGTKYEKEGDREKPFFVALKKVTDKKTFLFGLGVHKPRTQHDGRFYAHDFTFKETIRLGNINEMKDVFQPISDDEVTRLRFKDGNVTPALYVFDGNGKYYLDDKHDILLIKNDFWKQKFSVGFDKNKANDLLSELNNSHRPNIEQLADNYLKVCFNDHDKNEKCDYHFYNFTK